MLIVAAGMGYEFAGQGVFVGVDGAPKVNGYVAILKQVPAIATASMRHGRGARAGSGVQKGYALAAAREP